MQRVVVPSREAACQPRLCEHEHECRGDEGGDDRLERRRGEDQEQDGADDAADERRDAEAQDAAPLALELGPVAVRARDRSGHEPDRVRDVRRHRVVAERQQDGERDQRPAADDCVDRPRGAAGGEDRDGLAGIHRPEL